MKPGESFKGFSYDDGRIIPVAYFDGYHVGDRLLEGVIFRAEVVDGKLKVSFVNPNGEYEQGLNQSKWLAKAQEFAEENDVFCDNPSLSGDYSNDVVLET